MLKNQWEDGNFSSGEYKIKNAIWVIQTVERKKSLEKNVIAVKKRIK